MKKLKKLAGTLLAIILAGSVPAHDATYVDASVLADANVEYTWEHDHDAFDVCGSEDHCHDDHCHDCEGYAGAGIKIALLDAGVSDFETKKSVSFVGGKNEGSAHGNSMAAVLLSQVPEADIYDVKVLDDEGHGTYASVVAGIDWAIENGADIISMSFVGTERSTLLEDALTRAYEAGIFVVAAAGNYSDTEKLYPAAYPTVFAVGAVNEFGQTTYSNYGDYVDAYVLWDNGTSGAAQSIAGTAAYILGTEPGITVDQLFARFSSSVPEVLEKFDADNADTIVYACDSCLNYHYWGSWNVTRDSTCYSTGTKERKCNRCGKVEKEVIPVKSHVSKNVTDVDSTCTKTGTGHAECTLCGKTLAGYQIAAKGHNFGGWTTTAAATCTSNGTQQRTCSRCGAKETQTITAPGHSFGSWTTTTAATCTSNGTQQRTCSRCGGKETLTITAPGHSFGSWTTTTAATCTSNGTQQRTCSRCGGKETKTITAPGHSFGSWTTTKTATCTTDGTKERTCSICGAKETATIKSPGGHRWDSWKVTTANSCGKDGVETRVCLTCNQKETRTLPATGLHTPHGNYKITKAATCTTAGSKYLVCDTCGANCGTTTIPALGHSFGSWTTTKAATCTSNGTQQRTCSSCGVKETQTITAPGHSFGSWTTTKAATCTANGTQQRTCSKCGAKETKTITAPGHSFGSWTTTKAATCTTDGTKQRTCSTCGTKETATIKSPGGHRWDSWKVTTANSCGKAGVETRVCLTCNQKETRTLPATGLHTPHGNYKITKAATCTTAGSKYLVCDTCGANCGTTTIPALGHSFGNWTTTKAATCTANGTKQRTCSRCGVVETGTITKLGHAFGSWTTITKATCTTNGTKRRTCSKCGTVETATIQSPGGHKWDSWKVTTPNNCGKNGVETRVCLTCNQKETRTLPATGLHTPHGNYKITKTATCTTAGSKYLVCDTCGANCGTSVIPALGHDYGSWTTIKQATCTADGSKKHTCGRCGYTETVTIKSPGGHKWDSWKVTTPNNCGKDGVETRVCLTCNQKETRTIPATGLHTPHGNFKIIKAATCTTDGSKYLVCDTCGANCGTSVIPALGHKMGEWITVKSRTCTTDGTEKRVCERCDYTETRTVKSPGGHKWDSWKETTPVSCETDGVETRICLECREKQTRAIKHTGHVPGEWELVTEPTTKKPGEKVLKCTKCKEKLETKKVILIKLTGADSLDPICRDSGSTFGTLPTPSKPGYVFEGWVDARNTSKFVSANDTVSSSTSITLKAIWTLRSYTIRFEANRGGGSGNGSVDDISIKYGDDVRMPRNTYSCNISERPYSSPNFETIPQEFVGWSTTKDGTGAIFAEGQNIDSDILTACGAMSDGSVIPLYAIWRPSRPVTSDGGYTYTLTSWIIPNTTQDIRFDFGELLNGLPCGYRISIDAPSVIHTTWKNGDYIIPRMHNQSVQDMNRLQLTYIQETKNDVPVKYTITFTSDRGMTLDGNTSVVWVSSPHLMPDGFRVVEVYVCKDDLNHYLNAMEWADAEKTAKVTHENLQEAIIKRIQALGELEAKKFMKWLIPKYTLIDFCYKTVKEIAQGVSADNTFISPHDSVKWLTQKVEIANLCTPAKLDFELNGVGVELPFWGVDYGVHFTFVCDCKNTGEELFDPGHYFKISPERNNYLEAWDGMSISLRPGACGEFIVGRVAERDDQFFEKMLAKMTYPELKGVKENDIENGQYFLFDLGTFNKAK